MPSSDNEEFRLSKLYTNQLFKSLELGEVPITDFELTQLSVKFLFYRFPLSSATVRLWPVTTVVHPDTRSIYAIARVSERGFVVRRGCNLVEPEDTFLSGIRSMYATRVSWRAAVKSFRKWSERVAKAAGKGTGPDLWKQFNQSREFFENQTKEGAGNSHFTSIEQVEISVRIKQAKEYIHNSSELTDEQFSRIATRLEYIEEASKRIGRKDWLIMFNGTVLGMMVNDTITPQVAQHIFVLIVHGLGHFFGYGGPPLPLAGT
jgi:transposase